MTDDPNFIKEIEVPGADKIFKSSSDGKYYVSAKRKIIKVWDSELNECLHDLEGHPNNIISVAITPDNKYIVSSSEEYGFDKGKLIRIWDIKTGK